MYLKDDENSYTCQYDYSMNIFGNTFISNVLQYYAIIGCDATSVFHASGKINQSKEILKKLSCLCLKEVFDNKCLKISI